MEQFLSHIWDHLDTRDEWRITCHELNGVYLYLIMVGDDANVDIIDLMWNIAFSRYKNAPK